MGKTVVQWKHRNSAKYKKNRAQHTPAALATADNRATIYAGPSPKDEASAGTL